MLSPGTSAGARRLTWTIAASLALAVALPAQTAAPEEKKKEDVVVLSPFVVDASKDEGYRATSTLAGSRINTDLKDVASSITVVTKEFLTDIAAVDINDILAYTANTEGSRDYTATVQTLGRASDSIAANPQTANRLRGLASADIVRDYFYTIGTWAGFDTYNLDQVTINRGPNSVLAGLGSPAGIINYSPQTASVARNFNSVSLRYGSFGDQRATFNSNVVAKKDVLAFRVAGAYSDKGFKQEPSFNKDKRLYAAMTWQPWSKTTFRANYEHVNVKSNNPNTITPEDDVSQWVALGKPTYDRNSAAPVSSFLWADGNYPTVVYNKDGTNAGAFNTNTGYLFNQQNLTGVGLWTPIRMNSNKYLQLDELNLSPSLATLKTRTFSLSVDQEIVHGLNANVSYVNEKVDNDRLDLFRPEYANYLVDINQRTATGAVNPHFGETYMQFRGLDNKQQDHNTNEVIRGTLTYDLDLTKHNRWLGHYRVTGFAEERETETQHLQYNARGVDGTTKDVEIGYRYYLGGTDSARATTVPGNPGIVSGITNTYFDAVSGTFKTDTLSSYYALKSDQRQLVKLGSSAVVLQGYLWDNKIVGMYGLRRDKNQAGFSSSVDGGSGIVGPASPNYGKLTAFSKSTKTYGVVVHPLKWLSFHYNRAENFVPNAGSVDLLGKSTPSPTGLGKDYGFSLNLLDDKLNVKFNWFELTAANGNAGNPANFPLAQWNMTFMDLVVMPEAAAKAGIAYTPGVASGIIVGDPRIAYTADNVSKGLEIELTYNITKNWRVMASVAKQEAKQTNIAPALTAFVDSRIAYYKSANLWNNPAATGGSAWGLNQTGEQHFNQFLLGSYVGYKSVDGQPSTQLAKWHASALTNYSFSDGPLKGFSIGGAARYIEKSVIGNPVITDSTGAVTGLDLAHPYYNGGYVAIDAWIGYKMKIFDDKYNLSFQLNARDLQESGGFRPIVANSDGAHAVYRIVQPRTFYLTTTLEF
jgi:outer membrane receptor protein involved in Fe transport